MKKVLLILSLMALIVVPSCKDDEVPPVENPPADQLKLDLIPTFGNVDLQLDYTYITDEGYFVQFTDLKCYLTDLKNGSKTLASSALFDFRTTGTKLFTKTGKPADFPSLTGYLGVPSDRNHDDPTQFPTADPLYITIANDMHWGWNPGYIFMKVEAKVDTIDDGNDNFDHLVVFHVGGDTYLQNLNFSGLTWNAAGSNLYTSALKLDMKTFLNNGISAIDLKTEHSSHTAAGQEAISLKVMEHFRDALGIY
jgi:hypothetical protein